MSDEQTELTPEQRALIEEINDLSIEFGNLCQQRHMDGAAKYGAFAFMGKDMIREAGEELADLANYARYAYIKLRLMELTITENQAEFDAWRQSMVTEAPERPQHGFTPNGG